MKRIAIVALLIMPYFIFGQGISFFEGTWEEALEKASAEEKLIFVDAYAKWCGPCKKMAATSFKDASLGSFHSDHFISMKIDMEETMGRKFGQTYRVKAYPTLFYIDGKGAIVKQVTGFRNAEQLINLGNTAMKSVDNSGDYEEAYLEGNRDYDLVYNYVKELNKVGKPSLKISNDYLASNPNITQEQKLDFLYIATVNADSKIFDQMIAEKAQLEKMHGEDKIKDKVRSACMKTIQKSIEYEYPELMNASVEQYKSAYPKDADRFELEAKKYYAATFHRFDEWKDLNGKYIKKFGKKDASFYSNSIKDVKTHFSKNPGAKVISLDYATTLVKLDDATANYYTYIGLLIENEKKEEALKAAEEALKKAKSKEEKTKRLEQYIDYIKQI